MNTLAESLLGLAVVVGLVGSGANGPAEPPGTRSAQAQERLALVVTRYLPPTGSRIGHSGIFVEDTDGDGEGEILAGASPSTFGRNRFWYALERGPVGWQPRYSVLPRAEEIHSLFVQRGLLAARSNVFVGYEGLIAVHRSVDGRLVRELPVPGDSVSSLEIADVDADGRAEALYCDGSAVYVVELRSGATDRIWPYPCLSVAVGELDGDAALEVVIADGSTNEGLIVDGISGEIETRNPVGYGRLVRTGDLDGDGLDEVVAGHQWHRLFVYESDGLTERFMLDVFNLGSLAIEDLDEDGRAEVLFGDAQHGGIHAVDGRTGEELWMVGGGSGPSAAAVGNLKGNDDVRDVVWSFGGGTTAPDFVRSTNVNGEGFDDLTVVFGAPHYGADIGDIDRDGRDELVILPSSATSSGVARYFIFDPLDGSLLDRSEPLGSSSADGTDRVLLVQADDDPQLEVLTGTRGAVGLYDGKTHAQQWTTLLPAGKVGSMAVGDVDGDGVLEAVVGSDQPAQVTTLDLATGAVEWMSAPAPGGFLVLRIAEIDGDPNPEILVSDTDPFGDLYVYSADRGGLDFEVVGHAISAIDTPDLDGDGLAEVFVGTWRGEIWQLDPSTGAILEEFFDFPHGIDALRFHDVGAPGGREFAIAIEDELRLLDLSGAQLASYEFHAPSSIDEFGDRDSIQWETLQGRSVLLANLGRSGSVLVRVVPE